MKKKLNLLRGVLAGSLLSFASASSALAQSGTSGFFNNPQSGSVPQVVAQGTLGQNITTLINYFLGFLGLVAVAFIIYGGVLMVTSGGEEEPVTKAKKILTYAGIGIILILLSYTIVTFVTSALG